jgi:hypothetical protein
MTTSPQARLIYSASESDANMLWAAQFFAPDPFSFIEKRGKRFLAMSDIEMDRTRWRPGFTTLESVECVSKMWCWLQKHAAKIWFESLRSLKSRMVANILPHSIRGSH